MTSTQQQPQQEPLILYALFGSQYVFKVLAALQSVPNSHNNNIPYYVHAVPLKEAERRKVLPSGGLLVPELQVGFSKPPAISEDSSSSPTTTTTTTTKPTIVSDSERILEYFDQHKIVPGLYPTPLAHVVSQRASDGFLAASVWYYNWVDPQGHTASMRRSLGSKIPWFVPWFIVDTMIFAPIKTKFRAQVQSVLEKEEQLLNIDIDDEPAMRARLVQELEYFQSLLPETNDDQQQQYLLPNTTRPSAADFSVYALLERLVGDATTNPSSDVPMYPAIPELIAETTTPPLTRLWKWHDHMRTTYPVTFKGHRVPKELLSRL